MIKNSAILIGNGKFHLNALNEIFLELQKKSKIIAVDGGANTCRKYDISPDIIIGDLDSLTDENKKYFSEISKIIHITEQNSTDLEKALRTLDSDVFYCFGFTGDFFDHELNLLHILQKNSENFYGKYGKNKKIILFSETQIFFVLPQKGKILFPNNLPQKISFYPLTKTFFLSSSGLKYPLDNLELEQGKMIGTSNLSINPEISWKIKKGCCVGFFPIEYSQTVLENLYDITLD